MQLTTDNCLSHSRVFAFISGWNQEVIMEITGLREEFLHSCFCCLEDWSEEMQEAGDI